MCHRRDRPGGHDQPRHAAGVILFQRQDGGEVHGRLVVRQDRAGLTRQRPQIAAGSTQVARRSDRRVEDVERIDTTVAVAVPAPGGPGRRDELHRSHGAVVHRVAVEPPAVGVADQCRSVSVESNADGLASGRAVGEQQCPSETAVIGLHPSDGGEQRPRDAAGRVGGRDVLRSAAVRAGGHDRKAAEGQQGDRDHRTRARRRLGDAGAGGDDRRRWPTRLQGIARGALRGDARGGLTRGTCVHAQVWRGTHRGDEQCGRENRSHRPPAGETHPWRSVCGAASCGPLRYVHWRCPSLVVPVSSLPWRPPRRNAQSRPNPNPDRARPAFPDGRDSSGPKTRVRRRVTRLACSLWRS